MLFNSLHFILFFPVVLLLNFITPLRFRYLVLLACSYYFYMCWNAKYALLLLFSTAVTYLSGLLIKRYEGARGKQKLCVALSFILNLAVLFFFKYYNFAFDSLTEILKQFHIQLHKPAFDVLLPVGISFYTFQALSYTMDVYRGEIYAEKNFFRYALFVSFFPQLVAGPIERSKNLLKQLAVPQKFDFERFRDGLLLMLWGYFLKIVLADRIAIFVDTVYGNIAKYPGWYLTVASVLFAFQIYCDFAGYSVIAMGASEILGIRLMENFNAPYLSMSVAEFWRRWHISLSTWFRDYLYIPLGGSRVGTVRKYLNVMIVFLVSGLWHGAEWSFVVWGGLNGLFQVVGSITKPLRDKIVKLLCLNRDSGAHKLMQILVTFVMVDFAWIFFRAKNIHEAIAVVKSIWTVSNPWIFFDGSLYNCGLSRPDFSLMLNCLLILIGADIAKYNGIKVREYISSQDYWFRWIVLAGSALLILLVGIWGPGYNEANFIYFQF